MQKKIFELMNKKLDKDISFQEEKVLADALSKNKNYLNQFNRLSALFSNYKPDNNNHINHEQDLSKNVLNTIIINKQKNARYSMARTTYGSSFGTKLAYAFTFIFGIVLGGALIYLSYTSNEQDEQLRYFSLFGTMGDSGALSDFVEADSYNYDHSDLKANISTKYNNDMILLQYEVFSEEPVSVIIQFEERNLQFYASKKFLENSESSLLTSRNLIQVDNKGKNKFIFLFVNKSRRPDKIKLSVQKGSTLILESSLVTNN